MPGPSGPSLAVFLTTVVASVSAGVDAQRVANE